MSAKRTFHLVCTSDNDLFQAMNGSGYNVSRYDTVSAAASGASRGDAVLVLADEYPSTGPAVAQKELSAMLEGGTKILFEYPESYPKISFSEPKRTEYERTVVASDAFAPDLAAGQILATHGCWYLPIESSDPGLRQPLLVADRIAGYDTAVFGVGPQAAPLLIQLESSVLLATTALSRFVTARYAPHAAWEQLWTRILSMLCPDGELPSLTATPRVQTTYNRHESLPADAEGFAFRRSASWFRSNTVMSIDAAKCVVEGLESSIDHLGRQYIRNIVRGDCSAETALVVAWDYARTGNPDSKAVAAGILDSIWLSDDFYQGNPASPVYGHTNWNAGNPVFYGDDNARVLLSTFAAGRLLGMDRWDDRAMRAVCANFRTTGRLGFRPARIDLSKVIAEKQSWMNYRDSDITHFAPHYQAYLWSVFLWIYSVTGVPEFLEKPRTAIRLTMERFPRWNWTNGLTQEMARILLPLSFLLRVDDRDEHRSWIRQIASELSADLSDDGALQERMGIAELGRYPAPKSNEDYGTAEAAVIQKNGDPAMDLFYSGGFAALGLHEAAAATGDAEIAAAADRIIQFLVRVQTRAETLPSLDGTWMRSFDFKKWEYWGSSADLGWGAWCVESGWYTSWITSVLAMRSAGTTLFETQAPPSTGDRFKAILAEMLTERPFDPGLDTGAVGAGAMPGSE